MYNTGEVQHGNIGWHADNYIDRGEGSKVVSDAAGTNNTTIANDTNNIF